MVRILGQTWLRLITAVWDVQELTLNWSGELSPAPALNQRLLPETFRLVTVGHDEGLIFISAARHQIKQSSTNLAGNSSSLRTSAWLFSVCLRGSALHCSRRTLHLVRENITHTRSSIYTSTSGRLNVFVFFKPIQDKTPAWKQILLHRQAACCRFVVPVLSKSSWPLLL